MQRTESHSIKLIFNYVCFSLKSLPRVELSNQPFHSHMSHKMSVCYKIKMYVLRSRITDHTSFVTLHACSMPSTRSEVDIFYSEASKSTIPSVDIEAIAFGSITKIMEAVYVQCIIATIITFGFYLISCRPVILIPLLLVLYSLILFEKSNEKFYAALALLLSAVLFRRVGRSTTKQKFMHVAVDAKEETETTQQKFVHISVDAKEDTEGSTESEPTTFRKTSTTKYLDVIRNAEREAEERKAKQLEKWESSSRRRSVG